MARLPSEPKQKTDVLTTNIQLDMLIIETSRDPFETLHLIQSDSTIANVREFSPTFRIMLALGDCLLVWGDGRGERSIDASVRGDCDRNLTQFGVEGRWNGVGLGFEHEWPTG